MSRMKDNVFNGATQPQALHGALVQHNTSTAVTRKHSYKLCLTSKELIFEILHIWELTWLIERRHVLHALTHIYKHFGNYTFKNVKSNTSDADRRRATVGRAGAAYYCEHELVIKIKNKATTFKGKHSKNTKMNWTLTPCPC